MTAATLLAGGWDSAGAADIPARKYKSKHRPGAVERATELKAHRDNNRFNSIPEWYPHDSSQLPFGSQLWWRQREREGGGNRD
jgi:hypothetical protein